MGVTFFVKIISIINKKQEDLKQICNISTIIFWDKFVVMFGVATNFIQILQFIPPSSKLFSIYTNIYVTVNFSFFLNCNVWFKFWWFWDLNWVENFTFFFIKMKLLKKNIQEIILKSSTLTRKIHSFTKTWPLDGGFYDWFFRVRVALFRIVRDLAENLSVHHPEIK